MTTFVLTDAFIEIDDSGGNPIDFSDHAISVTLNYSGDLQEDTAMGQTTRSRISGLKDWSVEINLKQDFDVGEVDAILFDLIGGLAGTITIRPKGTDAVSSTNPNFSGEAVMESYPILGNGVGELAQTNVVFQSAGTLTRSEV